MYDHRPPPRSNPYTKSPVRSNTSKQDGSSELVGYHHQTQAESTPQRQVCAVTNQGRVPARSTEEVRTCTCRIKIEGTEAFVLIDTGSMVTIVNPAVIKQCEVQATRRPVGVRLKSASGHEIIVSHEVELRFTFGGETRKHTALICPDLLQDAIIGFDFIRQHNVQINAHDLSIRLANSGRIPLRAAEDWQMDQAGLSIVHKGRRGMEPTPTGAETQDTPLNADQPADWKEDLGMTASTGADKVTGEQEIQTAIQPTHHTFRPHLQQTNQVGSEPKTQDHGTRASIQPPTQQGNKVESIRTWVTGETEKDTETTTHSDLEKAETPDHRASTDSSPLHDSRRERKIGQGQTTNDIDHDKHTTLRRQDRDEPTQSTAQRWVTMQSEGTSDVGHLISKSVQPGYQGGTGQLTSPPPKREEREEMTGGVKSNQLEWKQEDERGCQPDGSASLPSRGWQREGVHQKGPQATGQSNEGNDHGWRMTTSSTQREPALTAADVTQHQEGQEETGDDGKQNKSDGLTHRCREHDPEQRNMPTPKDEEQRGTVEADHQSQRKSLCRDQMKEAEHSKSSRTSEREDREVQTQIGRQKQHPQDEPKLHNKNQSSMVNFVNTSERLEEELSHSEYATPIPELEPNEGSVVVTRPQGTSDMKPDAAQWATTLQEDHPSPSGINHQPQMQTVEGASDEPHTIPTRNSPGPVKADETDICIGPTSPDERQQLLEIVDEYPECFARNGELGACDLIQHRIELTSDVPVRRPAYKIAHSDRDFVEQEVREMLSKGVIEPSVSSYAAGVVLVPKKSGETRFCVDYRGLNQVTRADHYPLPLARSEIFDTLGEAKVFSCLDCQQGYWQVSVAEEDRHKTAFRCFLGLYQWRRVPFGLKTAPATYQRLMTHILSGYIGKFCHCFIDDVIIFSATFEEHLEHLRLVFARLKWAGIKLKPSKCTLAKEKVHYLGHVVSPGEIRPDPGNVSKIRDLETPTTVKQVRTFLGMASYYRGFVRDFSRRARPLTELTKQDVTFKWEQDEEAAFEDLKDALTKEPVLALPDFTKPFVLMTDGSTTGLGAVLGQHHDGEPRERVIGYASRRTSRLEESYSACELECMALVWATRHFRDYILGRKTEVITDHWALKWLQDLKNPNPRLQRWRIALQEFDLNISHKPGKQHRNADFLSRMYEDERRREKEGIDKGTSEETGEQVQEEVTGLVAVVTRSMATRKKGSVVEEEEEKNEREERPTTPTEVKDEVTAQRESPPLITEESPRLPKSGRQALIDLQKHDEDCQQLKQTVEEGNPPPSWAKLHTFRLSDDGVLERVSTSRHGELQVQIVLPQSLVRPAVQDAHAGHLKVGKTLGNLKRSFFFRNMYTICFDYISGCPECQQKDRGRKLQAPLGDMPKPLGAWHTVAVDVLGPLPQTRTGKKYVVVLTDYLTRFVVAMATKDQTAETTAEVLMGKFLEFGLPERLITDNGPNFRSRLVAEMCRLIRTAQLFTTPYHPQFDGLCERFNRTLTSMLRGFVGQHQRDWDKYLPYIMHAYRSAPQESTGETPFFLMFGRPCRTPLDLQLTPVRSGFPDATQEMAQAKPLAVTRMHKAFETVQARLQEAHAKQKKNHDKTSKERHFQVGDEVLLLDERVGEGETKKLHPPWRPGYRVVEIIGPLNYKLEHPSRRGRILRVHVNRIKRQIPEYVWPVEPLPETLLQKHADQLSASQRANRWIEEEKGRYRPCPRDHSPISDGSGEDEAEDPGQDQPAPRDQSASGPRPDETPGREPRPITPRPRAKPRKRPKRTRPFETPILRKSDRIQALRESKQ